MKKVCIKCQIELRPKENGVLAVSMASFGAYEVYEADIWHCPGCGWEGILGFGSDSVAQHLGYDLEAILAENAKQGRTIHRFWLNQKERNAYKLRFPQ